MSERVCVRAGESAVGCMRVREGCVVALDLCDLCAFGYRSALLLSCESVAVVARQEDRATLPIAHCLRTLDS